MILSFSVAGKIHFENPGSNCFFYNHVKATIKEVYYLWKVKKKIGDTGFSSFVFLFKPIFLFFFFCKTIMRKSVFQFFHSLCLVELICYSLCPQTLTNYYKLEKYFYFWAASNISNQTLKSCRPLLWLISKSRIDVMTIF